MDFEISPTQRSFLDRVTAFMEEHIVPAIPVYEAEMNVLGKPSAGRSSRSSRS
jgi:acyl-CoA dehydrogenase